MSPAIMFMLYEYEYMQQPPPRLMPASRAHQITTSRAPLRRPQYAKSVDGNGGEYSSGGCEGFSRSRGADKNHGSAQSLAHLALQSSLGNDVSALADTGSGRTRVRWAYSSSALKTLLFIFLLLIVLLVALVTIYSRGESIPVLRAQEGNDSAVDQTSENIGDGDAHGSSSTAHQNAPQHSDLIVVYVSGAVAQPGIVELPADARVADAVEKVGGLNDDAQQASINLAAPVADGQHIHVFAEGESYHDVVGADVAQPSADMSDTSGGGSGNISPSTAGESTGEKVNLNTASTSDLDKVPGIGPVMAERILTWRKEHGKFTSVDQLTQVEGIGQKTLDKLKDYVFI